MPFLLWRCARCTRHARALRERGARSPPSKGHPSEMVPPSVRPSLSARRLCHSGRQTAEPETLKRRRRRSALTVRMPLPTAALNVVVYAPATLAADGAPPAPDSAARAPEAAARRRRATCRAPPPLFTRAADRAARGGSAAATWDAATWAAMADEQPLPARPRMAARRGEDI